MAPKETSSTEGFRGLSAKSQWYGGREPCCACWGDAIPSARSQRKFPQKETAIWRKFAEQITDTLNDYRYIGSLMVIDLADSKRGDCAAAALGCSVVSHPYHDRRALSCVVDGAPPQISIICIYIHRKGLHESFMCDASLHLSAVAALSQSSRS